MAERSCLELKDASGDVFRVEACDSDADRSIGFEADFAVRIKSAQGNVSIHVNLTRDAVEELLRFMGAQYT